MPQPWFAVHQVSVEHTCRACGEEFDTRHGSCPACGAVEIPFFLRAGIRILLVNYDEDKSAGRHFSREEKSNVAKLRRWLGKGVLYVPVAVEDL